MCYPETAPFYLPILSLWTEPRAEPAPSAESLLCTWLNLRQKWSKGWSGRMWNLPGHLKCASLKLEKEFRSLRRVIVKNLQIKEHIYLELGKLPNWLNYLIHKALVELGARKHSGIMEWPILISPGDEGAALSVTFVQELSWLRGTTMGASGTPAKRMALPWNCLFTESICI